MKMQGSYKGGIRGFYRSIRTAGLTLVTGGGLLLVWREELPGLLLQAGGILLVAGILMTTMSHVAEGSETPES